MFGKKSMNGTDKFIMAKGRAVGNISPPKGSASLKGNGSVKKTAPAKKDAVAKPPELFTTKRGATPSKGKSGPVKL